ncbi:putative Cation efflux protein cytoplasmic domain-containing protein [Seiridium cardinale]|uniref:Cation efflux protein cytoplasmic domain-containing protein n=1 Tax=Seiridium cardinale TaxID=138064 RepID=A0ABR2XT90_9PEZI
MSSNEAQALLSKSPSRGGGLPRRGFLVLQDEAPPTFSPRGQGTLAHLIRNRSHGSLQNYGAGRRSSVVHDHPSDLEGHIGVEATSMLPHVGGHVGAPASDDENASRRSLYEERRLSAVLMSRPVRSMRLIGNSNPRYRWERYWKTEEQLGDMRKPIRAYYERTNYLIQQYLYIDRLLDSSLPHDLLNEYNDMPASHFRGVEIPDTIREEPSSASRSAVGSFIEGPGNKTGDSSPPGEENGNSEAQNGESAKNPKKVKRTPRDIYRATEMTPLFSNEDDEDEAVWDGEGPKPEIPWLEDDDDVDSSDSIVTTAIYINFAANFILLAGKIAVIISVSSMSVLASLVDAILDFLSTAIVWITTWLVSRQDQYKYPVGRRRLEPLGVLVFSVIMITSFVQVGLQSIQRLMSPDREVVELGVPAIGIMAGTIFIKGLCWLWCRLVKNSSVQALASDAMTDVIFNTGSILFPIVGYYAQIWWLDALGGLLLSLVVIFNWSQTSLEHIKNLSGFSATADQRNVLLYLTMRFARTIRQIQGLQAYHAGDKLNVEVDIVLDASTPLRDTHDLAESLQYVLESVPIVDRAFVHTDYATYNLPTHMSQQG